MFSTVLSPSQTRLLELLKSEERISRFYLAGGTGLALLLGHRKSEDFDFFCNSPFDSQEWRARLSKLGTLSVLQESEDTLTVEIQGVKVSFFAYPYSLLNPLEPTPWGFSLASIADIGAMKLSAVSARGSKRDFFDLYVICNGPLPLDVLLEAFRKKFSGVRFDEYHLLRSLNYFEDAEMEPSPVMLQAISWEKVKKFFGQEASKRLQ